MHASPFPLNVHPSLPAKRQIYDYIDRHITKLDKDCKAFDAGAVQLGGTGLVGWGAGVRAGLQWWPVRQRLAGTQAACPGANRLCGCHTPCAAAEIAKERQRLGLPPVEPTVGGGSVDTGGGGGKRKRKDGQGEQRKLTPEEQYQVGGRGGWLGRYMSVRRLVAQQFC